MIQTLEAVIREHPFFKGLEEPYIKLIVECAKIVRFDEGQILFRQMDPTDHFYLVRESLAAVESMIPHRGSTMVLTAGSAEVLGWSCLFQPYKWLFDARALRSTRALAFDGKCLRTKCAEDHDLGYELLKRFTRIVREWFESTKLQLMDLYGSNS